jgi:radical SAM superfamily enzyme YgiQ (UPF0313 family)
MKILLLQPNYDSHVVCPPFNLGYLASSLEIDKHQVDIFDGTLRNALEEDFLEYIAVFKPGIIGITVMSRGHNKVKKLISAIKAKFKIPVVIGGPQVTAFPEIVVRDLGADFAIVGEGELTIRELARYLEGNNKKYEEILGVAYFREDKEVRVNERRPLIKDLDAIPFPAWHLIPPDKYRMVPILAPAKNFPPAPLMTSRGCPHRCTFCASNVTWQYRMRMRSPQNVITEIKLLRDQFGVKEILISDDNFTASKKYAESVCDRIIEENLGISWQCSSGVRVDKLDLRLLKKMKAAGCYSVGLGIESGNQAILDKAHKKLDLAIVKNALRDLKRAGIKSYGFFIFGFPEETHATAQDTINFAVNNDFDRVWFNVLTPYPGSEIFDRWIRGRSWGGIDWDIYDGSTAAMDTQGLTKSEVEKYQKIAARAFYLRPKNLFNFLINLGPKQIITIFMTRFAKKYFAIIFEFTHRRLRKKEK